MKTLTLSGVAWLTLSGAALAGTCPAATVADMAGVERGAYPPVFELAEYQTLGNCTMEFAENPAARTKARRVLIGNPEYFEPDEQVVLYALAGMRVPKDDEIAKELGRISPREAHAKG